MSNDSTQFIAAPRSTVQDGDSDLQRLAERLRAMNVPVVQAGRSTSTRLEFDMTRGMADSLRQDFPSLVIEENQTLNPL